MEWPKAKGGESSGTEPRVAEERGEPLPAGRGPGENFAD